MLWNDLDDGVQEVRLKLLQHSAPIREPLAWLAVVASRVAVDWHRGRTREEGLRERLAARWSGRPTSTGGEEERVLALTVADCLDGLPAAQRQILTLRFYADLTVRDIAAVLEIPEGTVKSRLHTAVGAMRSKLRDTEVK
ncbi:RNA polymerase sigma factor [Nocardiopsis protaetiae]|uniref:RNA polymerase sigma factor n=1 Tax=Nocardiopsis protaetiae TaxID=3382270 RepID=UPI00387B0020